MIENPEFHGAFKKLFNDHFGDLCYYVLHKYNYAVASEADAENIVQDVFIKVWEKKSDISDPSRAGNLLYIMVRNACISKLRGRKSTIQPFDDYPDTAGEEETSDVDRERLEAELMGNIKRLRHNLDRLPEKSRQIIKALYFDQMSLKEYALLNNITEQSARNLKEYALRSLKKLMHTRRLRNWLLIWMLMVGPWKN